MPKRRTEADRGKLDPVRLEACLPRDLVRQRNRETHRVLVVDGCEDSRDVLCTVLSRRGWEAYAAAGADQGLRLARAVHPQVIVLDVDAAGGDALCPAYQEQAADQQATLVLLGQWPIHASSSSPGDASRHVPVAKPYHYGPLIRTIERLVGDVANGSEPAASSVGRS